MYTDQVSEEVLSDIDGNQTFASMASKISILVSQMTNNLEKIDTVMGQMKIFMDKITTKHIPT